MTPMKTYPYQPFQNLCFFFRRGLCPGESNCVLGFLCVFPAAKGGGAAVGRAQLPRHPSPSPPLQLCTGQH